MSDARFLLLDSLGERICVLWPLVPFANLQSEEGHISPWEISCTVAGMLGVSETVAAAEVRLLMRAGIIAISGGVGWVDPKVVTMLEAKGRKRLDPDRDGDSGSGGGDEDEEDEG